MTPPPAFSLSVQYADTCSQHLFPRYRIRRWVQSAILTPLTCVVRFVSEAEGRTLNRSYRGKDYATNVLTFLYDDEDEACPHTDIVLCTDVILREADAQGKTPLAHAAHLVIHGTLHAQGFGHDSP
ncbi:MAG: rRNA maturation RNase YbeY, partial [Burkholderiaceae bacterium]|nr:rRNA maturation RNase YbeY [Burkholderiaceae bacterium]